MIYSKIYVARHNFHLKIGYYDGNYDELSASHAQTFPDFDKNIVSIFDCPSAVDFVEHIKEIWKDHMIESDSTSGHFSDISNNDILHKFFKWLGLHPSD